MNDTLRSDLHDAKVHAKEAARATLLAMRSAIDFAIDKVGGAPEPSYQREPHAPAASAPPPPEGSMTSPPDDQTPGAPS
jgi:hypothetical protein